MLLQDKVGPFARSAADAAVVLDVIRGRDPGDPSSFDTHLDDPFGLDVLDLTVGYLPNTPPIVSYAAKHALPTLFLNSTWSPADTPLIVSYTVKHAQ